MYNALEPIVPGISEASRLYDTKYSNDDTEMGNTQHFDWVSKVVFRSVDPLSTSSRGLDYCGLGCFPIGLHASQSDFDTVLRSQTRLLKLGLLKPVPKDELLSIGEGLQKLADSDGGLIRNWSVHERSIVHELATSLTADDEEKEQTVEVYIGLDTGFRSEGQYQFWGVFDGDNDVTRLYISRNAKDLGGTILHTYLSSKRFQRSKCFEAEYALADSLAAISDSNPLPGRMLQDVEMLTPTEILVFLQAVAISGSSDFLLSKIRQQCEYELIDVSSSSQLKSLNTISYLRGEITVADLVAKRIQWYRQNKIHQLPRLESAIELFNTVDKVIDNLLRNSLKDQANIFLATLQKVLQPGKIDVRADIFALAVFCSFRRYAFEEVYLEATDRCPVFNDQPDQTVVFAELWQLGSHCEAYLDVTPKALGRILFDKYREYYDNHQPPLEADDPANYATAYPSAKTDIDREGITDLDKGWTTKFKGTAYLGVFAIPALVDILLLTSIGRGLYLSAYMSEIEQQMSTDSLVIALVLCGAVSSWIGAGGSYYLYAMVYPTMNMFMLTRFIGGLVFATIAAMASLLVIGLLKGIYAGLIFAVYLILLSTYLFLLGLMAILQFTGSPLPSVHSLHPLKNSNIRDEPQLDNPCAFLLFRPSSQHMFPDMTSSSISAFSPVFVSSLFFAHDKSLPNGIPGSSTFPVIPIKMFWIGTSRLIITATKMHLRT